MGFETSNIAKLCCILFGGIVLHWWRVECHNPIQYFGSNRPIPVQVATFLAQMQGGCIGDIGSCSRWFDSTSSSIRTKKFWTKGLELTNMKGEKNKATQRALSINCSSIDEALFHRIVDATKD